MALAPGTQEFAELKQTVESQIKEGNITSKNQLKGFLEQNNIDFNEFMQVDADYEKQKSMGFDRESSFDPGKIIGKATSEVAEGVATVGGQAIEFVAGKEKRQAVEGAVKDAANYIDNILPKSVRYALKETFDPRTSTAEEVASEIAAFAAPAAALTKATKGIKFASKLGKAAKAGTIGVAADVLIRDEDEQITLDILNLVPEAEPLVEALTINPDDSVAEKRLKQIIDSATGAGVLTIAGAVAAPIIKRGGKKIFGKFNALRNNNVIAPITNTPNAAVLSARVDEIAPGVYRQAGKVKEVLGKINTKIGRGFTSTAAMPKPLFKSFVDKQQAVEAADLFIQKETKALEKLLKETGVDRQVVNKMLANETVSQAERAAIPDAVAQQVTIMRNKIDENSVIIKDMLELDPSSELSATIDEGLNSYLTRTFEFSSNPKWSKDITKALKGKLTDNPNNADVLRVVSNARNYIARNNPTLSAAQVDGLIQDMVARGRKGDAMGVITDIMSNGYGGPAAKILTSRKKIDKPILELFGEVKDPVRNFSETITNQNKLIAKAKYLQDIKKFAEQNLGKEVKLGGIIPGIPSDTATFLNKAEVDVTKNLGELAAKELGAFGAGGEALGLNKFVTTDQMYTMLENGIDTFSINKPGGSLLLNIFAKPAALGQAAETVFDHTAHLANTYGMFQQLAMNGNLFRPSVMKNAQKSAYTIYQKAAKKDPEALKLLAELKKRGVIDSNIVTENIKKNIDRFGEGVESGLMKTLKAPLRGASGVYGAIDDFGKVIAIQAEMNAYRKAYPMLSESQLLDKAAEVVRNTMPSYTTALPAVRALSRLPLGTYATFPAEVLRTQKNIISQGIRDIAEAKRTGNRALALTGIRRLSGVGATTVGIEAMVSDNNSQMDITEADQRAVKLMSPDYQKNTIKLFTQPFYKDPKTGRVMGKFTDSGALDAAQYVKGPVRSLIGRVLAGEDVTQREIDDMFGEAVSEVYSPFVSEKFLTTAILNSLRGVDAEGKPIDSIPLEFLKVFEPGTSKAIRKAWRAEASELVRGEGRGQTVSGFPLRKEDADFFLYSGIRNNTIDINKSVGFSLYQDIQEVNKSREEFERYLKSIPDKQLTSSDIQDLYQKYADLQLEKKEAMARLSDKINVFKDIEFYEEGKDGKMYKTKFGIGGVLKAASDDGKFKPSEDLFFATQKGKEGRGVFMPDDIDTLKLLKQRKFSPEVISGLKEIQNSLTGRTLREKE